MKYQPYLVYSIIKEENNRFKSNYNVTRVHSGFNMPSLANQWRKIMSYYIEHSISWLRITMRCALTHVDKQECQYFPVIIFLQYFWEFLGVFLVYSIESSLFSFSLRASDKGTDPGEMAGGVVEVDAGGVGVVPQGRWELQALCWAALLLLCCPLTAPFL